MFRAVPDADYVYCRQGTGFPLASTAFVRYCQAVWLIVYTATTWGEFVDRLGAFDPGLLDYAFGPVDDLFDAELGGRERTDEFSGADSVADCGLPIASGERDPYRSWDTDMPDEIITLAESHSAMIGGDYWELPVERLPAALEVTQARGELAVEDCELFSELAWLGGEWPPPPRPA